MLFRNTVTITITVTITVTDSRLKTVKPEKGKAVDQTGAKGVELL